MRALGLDIGTKRIGVAVSDPLYLTAQGLTVLKRGHEMAELQKIIDEMEVSKIVVGLPKNMDGSIGPKAQEVLDLIEELRTHFSLPIQTWDERLSTVAAQRVLIEADLSRAKRRKVIDKTAAVLILQSYLDFSRKNSQT